VKKSNKTLASKLFSLNGGVEDLFLICGFEPEGEEFLQLKSGVSMDIIKEMADQAQEGMNLRTMPKEEFEKYKLLK